MKGFHPLFGLTNLFIASFIVFSARVFLSTLLGYRSAVPVYLNKTRFCFHTIFIAPVSDGGVFVSQVTLCPAISTNGLFFASRIDSFFPVSRLPAVIQ